MNNHCAVLKDQIQSGNYEVEIKGKKIKITPELFNEGIMKSAMRGNSRAWEMIMAYLEGTPVQRIQQETEQNLNIIVKDEAQKAKLQDFLNG